MSSLISRSAAVVFFLFTASAFAQEVPPTPQPTAEHQWLGKFSGDWSTDCSAVMGPDQPALQCVGSISSRKIGDLWVQNEMKGETPGGPMTGLQTIGYDAEKKKYIGTWIDSSSTFMWKYVGTLDKETNTLTLEAEGPSFFSAGKMAMFRDSYQFRSDDEFLIRSQIQAEDGSWITFMSGTAKRRK